MTRFSGRWLAGVAALAIWAGGWSAVWAVQITLRDGRVLTGREGRARSMAEMSKGLPSTEAVTPLVFLNDDLRRTWFPQRQVAAVGQQAAEVLEKFTIRQRILRSGRLIHALGPLINTTPLDVYGRRTYRMNTPQGALDIIQGITEITPHWTKIEGISHVLDMRMATTTIPTDILAKIVARQIEIENQKTGKKDDVEDHKRIARFCLQCEWYGAAERQLQQAITAHPEVKPQLATALAKIQEMKAKQLLDELKLRGNAGQHVMVRRLLDKFPAENVAGETLQEVRQRIQDYKAQDAARDEVLKQFDNLSAQVADAGKSKRLAPIRKELGLELSLETLNRMAAFRQFLKAANVPPDQKLALAISGWFLGAKGAITNLSTALSLYDVRAMVRQYLTAEGRQQRMKAIAPLESQAAGNPDQIAELIAHMKPPLETDPPNDEGAPYRLEIPGAEGEPPISYLLALPPEYNPYHRYPAIVTLRGVRTKTEQQIDFWSGPMTDGGYRAGQGSRRGYIVIAPEWAGADQERYAFTAREHSAVLNSLRDACKRFSIDTDQVFLTGHAAGGTAAWDIGLAHPDYWAGVIPIDARREKYIEHYTENAALVPFYFVNGELDLDKMTYNAMVWDRYFNKSKPNAFNVTVAEYLGRGNEYFPDEIQRMFDWMGRMHRNFFPKEFSVATMRPGTSISGGSN